MKKYSYFEKEDYEKMIRKLIDSDRFNDQDLKSLYRKPKSNDQYQYKDLVTLIIQADQIDQIDDLKSESDIRSYISDLDKRSKEYKKLIDVGFDPDRFNDQKVNYFDHYEKFELSRLIRLFSKKLEVMIDSDRFSF